MSEDSLVALPSLASAILMTAEAEESSLRAPVSCGLATIDDLVLDGGFRYGEITSIAGATATGKTLVGSSLSNLPIFQEKPGQSFYTKYSRCSTAHD